MNNSWLEQRSDEEGQDESFSDSSAGDTGKGGKSSEASPWYQFR